MHTSPIQGLFFDISQFYHDPRSNGDTWDHIWADDDDVYTFNCDGRGYGTEKRNVSFSKLTGKEWNEPGGIHVNGMDYGTLNEAAPNGSNWKVTGADCIDGVFYAFVANNWYGWQNAYGRDELDSNIRQTVDNMSLIKSTDRGVTWTRDAESNYRQPMWVDRKFSTAYFVKYGRNGGDTNQDDQDSYVYAISNDGFWNCGSHFYLGRVQRCKIGDLDARDWEFLSSGAWSAALENATPIPGFPNGQMKCTMGSPIWLAAIKKYVTVTWYDPGTSEKWHYPENVAFAFYQADHPWGPWSYIGEKSAADFIAHRTQRISRWYGPSLSPKFISSNGDDSVTAILLFSGQLWDDTPDSLYKNNALPVTFCTQPQLKDVRTFNDTEAVYTPGWRHESARGVGDFEDDVHITDQPDEYADFSFTGRGIEILAEKAEGLGQIEIIIDGSSRGIVSLQQDPMPLLYQVEVYRDLALADCQHALRIINCSTDGKPVLIDGFRVYRGADFDSSAGYLIVNRVTRNVLEVLGDGVVPRAPSSNLSAALWQIQAIGSVLYRLTNLKCGRILGPNAIDGKVALLNPTAQAGNAGWRISPVGNASFTIVGQTNGYAITEQLSHSAQTAIAQLGYVGRDVQKWEIIKAG